MAHADFGQAFAIEAVIIAGAQAGQRSPLDMGGAGLFTKAPEPDLLCGCAGAAGGGRPR